jgi:hypothetical protein
VVHVEGGRLTRVDVQHFQLDLLDPLEPTHGDTWDLTRLSPDLVHASDGLCPRSWHTPSVAVA